MPASMHIALDAKAMGYNIIINYIYSIRYKDYEVNPIMYLSDTALKGLEIVQTTQKQPVISKKSEKIAQQITEITNKEKLTTRDAIKLVDLIETKNREDQKNNPENDSINPLELQQRDYSFTVDSNASYYDSAQWESYRTIPLTDEEAYSFEQKRINDSIQEEKEKTLETLVKKRKGISLFKNKIFPIGISPEKSTLAFNTVDGFKIGIHVYLNKRLKDSVKMLRNGVNFGYDFAQKHFFLYGSSQWNYNPKRFASIEIFGGKQDCDFNTMEQKGKYFTNSLSSLFFRDNFIQYYGRIFAGLQHKIEVFNGFQTAVGLSYEQQHPLENRSDYSFFFRKTRNYKSNIPDNEYVLTNLAYISQQTAFLMDISISYTPKMYYRLYRNKKIKHYAGSVFPTFTLMWKKGISNVLASNSNFDYLHLNIYQNIDLKLFKSFQYVVSAGFFPNKKSLHFSNFSHFQTNNFWLVFNTFYGTFNTMPTYKFSTNEWFLSAHTKYETLYLMLKFIPGLNKTLITENLHLSFLTNPLAKTYIEAGYSLSQIFLIGNIGFFVGLEDFKSFNWSIRGGISLGD
jgi:flavodoxin